MSYQQILQVSSLYDILSGNTDTP